jgi:hypothetical protein
VRTIQRLTGTQLSAAEATPLAGPRWRLPSLNFPQARRLLAPASRLASRATGADMAFVALLLTIAALRWLAINSVPEPSGVDAGNWLAFGHSFLGSHSRSASVVIPPFVPMLVLAFGAVFGQLKGIQVLAAMASLAPAAGAYVLLRRHVGFRAVLLAGLIAPAMTTGEATAWGGYPQLIGLGLLPLILWALDRFVTERRLQWAWATSILLFLGLFTSDLIGAASVVIALVFLVLRTLQVDKAERPSRRLLSLGFIISAIPSMTLIPIYLGLASGVLHNAATKVTSQRVGLANLLPSLTNLFKENVYFWYLLLVIALLSPLVLLARRRQPLAAAATAILAPTVGAVLILHELRVLFLLPLAIACGLGAIWNLLATSGQLRFISFDSGLIAGLGLALAVESGLGIVAYQHEVQWYTVLTPGLISGLRQMDKVAPRDSVLAVSQAPNPSNQNGWPAGWWVEGLLDRPTYYVSSLEWLNFADERRRATAANQMFGSPDGMTGTIRLARSYGVTYIVAAKGWPDYREWVSRGGALEGAKPVIDTESLLVLSLNG